MATLGEEDNEFAFDLPHGPDEEIKELKDRASEFEIR
jgi:hypothetical protein